MAKDPSRSRYLALIVAVFVIAFISGTVAGLAAALAAPTPAQLLETPDLSGVSISPDGATVVWRQMQASVSRNRSEATWWTASVNGVDLPRQIGEGGDAILTFAGLIVDEAPQWSKDSSFVYYRALIDGAVQIWRARRDGGGTEQVTHGDADVATFKLNPDGRTLSFTVGASRGAILDAENAEADQGVRLDATIDPGQAIIRGGVINGRLASQRITGAWFGRSGLLFDQSNRTLKMDLTTLRPSAEALAEPLANAAPKPLDTASLYAQSATSFDGRMKAQSRWDGARAHLTIAEVGLDDRLCSAEPCRNDRITTLVWRPGDKFLLFTTINKDRHQTLYVWDLGSNRVRRLYQAPGLFNGGAGLSDPCAVSAKDVVCIQADALSPPHLVAVGLQTGAAHGLAAPGAGLAQDQDLIAQTETWTDADGHPFVGHLLRPRNGKGTLPLMINYYHCDGYLKGGYGNEWPLAPLAAAGIATLCIEMAPLTLPQDGVAMYRTAAAGIGVILDRLSASGVIDPKRVCMSGLSFGSEVTMFIAMHTDRLACVSIASPQVSPLYYWMNGIQGRDNHRVLREVWGLGAPDETPEQWKLLSPALDVKALRMPLLMQLPEQEYRWDLDFLSAVSRAATPSETWIFPDEMHQKAQPRHKLVIYNRNLDWFRFWLQGYVDADPMKADQYRRWQAKALAAGITPGSGQRASIQELTQASASAH